MSKTNSRRHVVCLSGGKDSTALAFYLRDRIPEVEYIFTDTGEELNETYEYLSRIESFLNRPITRLNSDRPFKYWVDMYGGFLPSPQARWCTRALKIKPLEEYLGGDETIMYVGIRADEDRDGYIDSGIGITAAYPFKEDDITIKDVYQILDEVGIGLPEYYKWRSRSGCYFCFFQRKIEWVGLLKNHPDLFKKAMDLEKFDEKTGRQFTWRRDESLKSLSRPERVAEIIKKHKERTEKEELFRSQSKLVNIFGSALEHSSTCGSCSMRKL